MDILRITVRWLGFLGAPGYSNFYFSSDAGFWDGGVVGDEAQIAANRAAERVSDAFGALRSVLPEDVQIDIDQEALVINSDTGEALGFTEVSTSARGGNLGTGGYSGPSGAVVNWRTNDYRFGRRIRGRTFLVPLAGDSYEDDGTLTSDSLGALRSFGSEMLDGGGDPQFGVWSRPRDGAGGVFASATGYNVPDMAAVLRSRRD